MTLSLQRFNEFVKRFGCVISPLSTKVNGVLTRRPDIMKVERHGDFIMVIPRNMYAFPNSSHRDLGGRPMWDYFKCEQYFLIKINGK